MRFDLHESRRIGGRVRAVARRNSPTAPCPIGDEPSRAAVHVIRRGEPRPTHHVADGRLQQWMPVQQPCPHHLARVYVYQDLRLSNARDAGAPGPPRRIWPGQLDSLLSHIAQVEFGVRSLLIRLPIRASKPRRFASLFGLIRRWTITPLRYTDGYAKKRD